MASMTHGASQPVTADRAPDRPAIEVEGLAKRFGDVVAVDRLSFVVPHGRVVGLLGGNGAGKTTTIAMLLGLLEPSEGEVRVLGLDITRHRGAVIHRMNFSSPYVQMPGRLTVRENLAVYGRLYGVRRLGRRLDDLAEGLDLGDLMKRQTNTLSAGQRSRMSLAKALLNEPDVLLLDEPTASLDPDSAAWIRDYLSEYQVRTGAAILLASHNMLEVERVCHHVLMMRRGRLVDEGTPADLIARFGRATLEEVFLDVARGTSARQEAAQ